MRDGLRDQRYKKTKPVRSQRPKEERGTGTEHATMDSLAEKVTLRNACPEGGRSMTVRR